VIIIQDLQENPKLSICCYFSEICLVLFYPSMFLIGYQNQAISRPRVSRASYRISNLFRLPHEESPLLFERLHQSQIYHFKGFTSAIMAIY
jgi:hypothetical protein